MKFMYSLLVSLFVVCSCSFTMSTILMNIPTALLSLRLVYFALSIFMLVLTSFDSLFSAPFLHVTDETLKTDHSNYIIALPGKLSKCFPHNVEYVEQCINVGENGKHNAGSHTNVDIFVIQDCYGCPKQAE